MLLAFFFVVSFFVWPNKTFRNAVVGSVIYDKLNSEPEPNEKDPLLESSDKVLILTFLTAYNFFSVEHPL